jgi:hypothetical protein
MLERKERHFTKKILKVNKYLIVYLRVYVSYVFDRKDRIVEETAASYQENTRGNR